MDARVRELRGLIVQSLRDSRGEDTGTTGLTPKPKDGSHLPHASIVVIDKNPKLNVGLAKQKRLRADAPHKRGDPHPTAGQRG